ncbi:MAG: hypothetical protein ABIJ26_01455, partial [Candidatus Margulisiibacteriota bacterium]
LVSRSYISDDLRFGLRSFGPWHDVNAYFSGVLVVLSITVILLKLIMAKGTEKKNLRIIFIALVLAGFIGVSLSNILPLFGLSNLDNLAPLPLIVSMTMIAFAIISFGAFSRTPSIAATDILDSLGTSIIVCDLNKEILFQKNNIAARLESQIKEVVDLCVAHGHVNNYQTFLDDKAINISAKFFREGGGIVLILHDMTSLEKAVKEEMASQLSIKARLDNEARTAKILAELASVESPEKVEQVLMQSYQEIKDDSSLEIINNTAIRARERFKLLDQIKYDQSSLREKIEEENEINKHNVERELEMIDLKKKISQLEGRSRT